jgi:hypothetical protein
MKMLENTTFFIGSTMRKGGRCQSNSVHFVQAKYHGLQEFKSTLTVLNWPRSSCKQDEFKSYKEAHQQLAPEWQEDHLDAMDKAKAPKNNLTQEKEKKQRKEIE